MSVSQSKKSKHIYVQYKSLTDIVEGNAKYERRTQKKFDREKYDKEIAIAQEIDSIITSTGENLARILGVTRIVEKPGVSRWLHRGKLKDDFTRAVRGDCDFMEHPRTLHAGGCFIGDLASPYTLRVGVGWGKAADVQQIADALQYVLEVHNYGVTSTRKRPAPRRIVVLDEAHSLYAPISKSRGNSYNISILVLRADMVTDDVAALLQRDLGAGVGRVYQELMH